MPIITVGDQQFEAPAEKRLVLALEDAGIDILHRCGGYARCTTCRVEFQVGEPRRMTEAEKNRLQTDDQPLYGKVRLSCQVLCEQDMDVTPVYQVATSEVDNPGKRPEDHMTPEPVWTSVDY
ncbi:MAG: (2Fe-2S)-binding protein [Anaerolineae bacterium]|nr:(2Fe-2S)-binding protein [Anaerolineae bacterium]